MLTYQGKKGIYQLSDKPFASGGEGAIYKVSRKPDVVAKLYTKNPTAELEQKLSYMASNPPDASVLNEIAWPLDILYDQGGKFVGFIMPKMSTDSDLTSLYSYNVGTTPLKNKQLNYQQRVIVAINICIVISAVHAAGYTFGDFNPNNIGVNTTTGHVGFFDTDSYHITDRTNGKTYRCAVVMDGYVAPELIKACKGISYLDAPLPTFTQQTDLFALAIHIFKLLMNGFTPFNGIRETENASTASPGLGNKAIEKGNYCFKPGKKPQSAAIPELSVFPEKIRDLFTHAFIGGENDPYARPNAEEWKSALTEYLGHLKVCRLDPSHYYWLAAKTCPYCDADKRYKAVMGGGGQYTFPTPVVVPGASGGNGAPKKRSTSSGASGNKSTTTKKPAARKPAAKKTVSNSAAAASSGSPASSRYSGVNSPSPIVSNYNPSPVTYAAPPEETARGFLKEHKKKILLVTSIVLSVILFLSLPTIIRTCSEYAKEAKYSESQFSVSILSKSGNVLKISVENASSEAIDRLTGTMKIKTAAGEDLYSTNVTLTGSVAGNSSGSWNLTLTNADMKLAEAKLENLIVYFRITSLSFEDGTYKNYTSNEEKVIYGGSGFFRWNQKEVSV